MLKNIIYDLIFENNCKTNKKILDNILKIISSTKCGLYNITTIFYVNNNDNDRIIKYSTKFNWCDLVDHYLIDNIEKLFILLDSNKRFCFNQECILKVINYGESYFKNIIIIYDIYVILKKQRISEYMKCLLQECVLHKTSLLDAGLLDIVYDYLFEVHLINSYKLTCNCKYYRPRQAAVII